MDKIQVLRRSLLFDVILGLMLTLIGFNGVLNPPIYTTCQGSTCFSNSPPANAWSWGVLYLGILLLVESVAVWFYVKKDQTKVPT